jgi:hypothetical protein
MADDLSIAATRPDACSPAIKAWLQNIVFLSLPGVTWLDVFSGDQIKFYLAHISLIAHTYKEVSDLKFISETSLYISGEKNE